MGFPLSPVSQRILIQRHLAPGGVRIDGKRDHYRIYVCILLASVGLTCAAEQPTGEVLEHLLLLSAGASSRHHAAMCLAVISAEVPLARYSQPVAVVLVATMGTPMERLTSSLLRKRQAPGPVVPPAAVLVLPLSAVSEEMIPLFTRLENS